MNKITKSPLYCVDALLIYGLTWQKYLPKNQGPRRKFRLGPWDITLF